MRLGFLGCIHGNVPALEAVLADAGEQAVARLVAAGDVIGWGPEPHEALMILRSRGILSIRGHDERRALDLALDRERDEWARGPRSTEWTLERLADGDVEAIGAWPLSYAFDIEGR